jgi:hypothetical protein
MNTMDTQCKVVGLFVSSLTRGFNSKTTTTNTDAIIIIIIIIIILSFMQGINTYISETNYVPREYSVAAILLLLFMVLISPSSYYYFVGPCIGSLRPQLSTNLFSIVFGVCSRWFPVLNYVSGILQSVVQNLVNAENVLDHV